jgi:hypothetical protein
MAVKVLNPNFKVELTVPQLEQVMTSIGLTEVTNARHKKNGTRCWRDMVSGEDCQYTSHSNGYVRRYHKGDSNWGWTVQKNYQLNPAPKTEYDYPIYDWDAYRRSDKTGCIDMNDYIVGYEKHTGYVRLMLESEKDRLIVIIRRHLNFVNNHKG